MRKATCRSAAAVLLILASCGGVTSVHAQDGLQRFERDIKPQLEFKQFTYAKGSALGDKGFVLNDVVAVVPGGEPTGGKDTTVKIEKVTVEEIDFDRLKKDSKSDDVPRFAKLSIQGMTGDDTLSGMLEAYGVPKAPVDLALDYRLDGAAKLLTISKIELGLRGQGRLALSLTMEGVSDKTAEAMNAKDTSRLRTAALMFDDVGLLATLLPAVAKQQGTVPEAMVAMAVASIGVFANGQGPDTVKALDAAVSFVGDWKKPKGPIKVSVTPSKSASFDDLDKLGQPNALTEIFGLRIDYAGMRAGAAAAGAGGQSAAASPPAAAPSGTITGAEAWMSIIGNTLTGRIDGEVIFEHYRKDGTLALMEGSEITKGKWSLEGEKVCFKYPDEDKDCLTLSRTGDEVTFTRSNGKKAYRLKFLAGNPKNL